MPFGDSFRRPRPDLIGSQVPNQLPAPGGQMFPAARPKPSSNPPIGQMAGFQTGVAANPTNTAYEDFLNQAAAEGRRTQPGGQAGQRIFGGRHRKLPTFPGPTTQPTQPLPRMR